MALPGFTADNSVYRSRRPYRTDGQPSASTSHGSVMPQGEIGEETSATCCGEYCSGICMCRHGHFSCVTAVKAATSRTTLLQATDRVAMAIDACHAEKAVDGAQAFAACACGCWASVYHAGCIAC